MDGDQGIMYEPACISLNGRRSTSLSRRASQDFLSRADHALLVSRLLQPTKAPSSGQSMLSDNDLSNPDSPRAISSGHRRLSMVVLSVDTDCKPSGAESPGMTGPPSPMHIRRLPSMQSGLASAPHSPLVRIYSRGTGGGTGGAGCGLPYTASAGGSPTAGEGPQLHTFSIARCPQHASQEPLDGEPATPSDTHYEAGKLLPRPPQDGQAVSSPRSSPVTPSSRQVFATTSSPVGPPSPNSSSASAPFGSSVKLATTPKDRDRDRQPFSALRAACNHLARSPSMEAGLNTIGRFGSTTRRGSLLLNLVPPSGNLLATLGVPYSPTGEEDPNKLDGVCLPLQSPSRPSLGPEGLGGSSRRHSVMLAPGSSDAIMIHWAPRPGRREREEYRQGLLRGEGGEELGASREFPGHGSIDIPSHGGAGAHDPTPHLSLPSVRRCPRPGHGTLAVTHPSQTYAAKAPMSANMSSV